jgi:hypothetical protein
VASNDRLIATGTSGPGEAEELAGHKFFVSAQPSGPLTPR